ncbi:MAG TPA: hypothetical protein P5230_04355 [Candidatus Magasanikbacteria bacterium]|nr:hypothetical protein [Candidatus Magasanikbacteria bacterium]
MIDQSPPTIQQQMKDRVFSFKSFLTVLEIIDEKRNPQGMEIFVRSTQAKIFIEAFCFELVLKIFYLLDKNTNHPTNHELDQIFNDLNEESKLIIQQEFENKIKRPSLDFSKKLGEEIYVPDFDETLLQAKEIIINFKYDAKLSNGSIINKSFLKEMSKKIDEKIESKIKI